MNRREFLKTSAVIGGSFVVATPTVIKVAELIEPIIAPYPIGGRIKLYAGPIPKKPSAILDSNLLCEIVLAPFELTEDNLAVTSKPNRELGYNSGVAEASGTATYLTLESPDGKYKALGSVGLYNANLVMSSTSIITGGTTHIDHMRIGYPPSASNWFGKKKPFHSVEEVIQQAIPRALISL